MYAHLEPIVLTSSDFDATPEFTGYAFNGPDLIIGRTGYREWLRQGNAELSPHLDGCYMLKAPCDGGVAIGADYKGYCKLYVYRQGTDWAVSNSFAQLLSSVRSRGWITSPDVPALSTWSIPGGFWQQLPTFNTAVREVNLLPRSCVLWVDNENRLHQIEPEAIDTEVSPEKYRESLRLYAETWVGRIGTILQAPLTTLTTELTGGLDSRTTLSLALAYRQFTATSSSNLSISSSINAADDYNIAKSLATVFSLGINDLPDTPGQGSVTLDQYKRWHDFALGSYGLIYWPPATPRTGRFAMGGHGGEGHRSYWRYESPRAALLERRDRFDAEATFRQTLGYLEETSNTLQRHYPSVHPTLAHYREFRDRLHSGLHALNQVRLQPLASGLLYKASHHLTQESISSGQMLYDIISQTTPSLLGMPFDSPEKAPTQAVIEKLVAPSALQPRVGTIFGLNDSDVRSSPSKRRPWKHAIEVAEATLKTLPEGLVQRRTVRRAREAMKEIKTAGKLRHPKYSLEIHHVLLAGLATEQDLMVD